MDENEQSELSEVVEEQVSGHMSSTAKIQKRSGRGFAWDSTTGKYVQM